MLRVSGLTSGYGRITVLRDLNLEIGAGEIVALLGRNGVGKTTLMKTLSGALKSQSGQIEFSDQPITGMPASDRAKLGIGYVPQGRGIFTKLTVLENLLVGLYATNGDEKIIEKTLTEFPALRPKLNHRGGDLSGGQQQILALARALTIQPKLLLLDEPSEGIQPSILDEISDILNTFKLNRNIAILIVEQNIDFVKSIADRAYLMDVGSIAKELSGQELMDEGDWLGEFIGGADIRIPAE